jgi:hypothetical protein
MILCLRTNHGKEDVYPSMELTTQEVFEDTNWVIIIRFSKKNKQHNSQQKKYKRTNNDLLNSNTNSSSLSLSLS